jgi:uncharacterized protein DUF4123
VKLELNRYLFRENAYTYAVLDGASVPNLPQRLFESDTTNMCLYRGELTDELIHVAPYLVHLSAESKFTDWLLSECWGKHWGIFVQTEVSPTSLRKHFRSLITVNDEAGNPMLFRFYDPRVLVPFLLTCAVVELEAIFGPVRYYFAESFDRTELFRMHIANGALVETRLGIREGVG